MASTATRSCPHESPRAGRTRTERWSAAESHRDTGDVMVNMRGLVTSSSVLSLRWPAAWRSAEAKCTRCSPSGIATASDLVRRHVPELGDGARPVSMTTLILAGALSSYCRPSASALAAYEADPTVLELRLDLRTALESAVATLIAGTLARS